MRQTHRSTFQADITHRRSPGRALAWPPVTPAPLRSDRQHTNRVAGRPAGGVISQETGVMPEQPKPQPKPQESTPDTRERARAALQMSMDRRG
ncbi:hypothetical protein GCM10027610_137600 [Dactylosporangium cerinum]